MIVRTLQVSVAATNKALVSLDLVKAELEIAGTGSDGDLTEVIGQVSDQLAGWCRRVFASETVVETVLFCGEQPETLTMGRFPVSSVASVVLDGTTLVANTDYLLNGDVGMLLRLSNGYLGRGWRGRKLVMTYTAGFVLPDDTNPTLPKAVERAALLLVKSAWLQRSRDSMVRGIEEEVPGVLRVRTDYWVGGAPGADAGDLPPDVAALAEPYRQMVI